MLGCEQSNSEKDLALKSIVARLIGVVDDESCQILTVELDNMRELSGEGGNGECLCLLQHYERVGETIPMTINCGDA